MKYAFLIGALFTFNAFACSTYEAQFMSTIKEMVRDEANPSVCKMKLDIDLSRPNNSFRENPLCPIYIEDVLDTYITTTRCDLKAGDTVSGYLVTSENGIELE